MAQRRQFGPIPPPQTQPMQNQPSGEGSIEDKILDFLGGIIGDVEPGNPASGLGGLTSMLPIVGILKKLGQGGRAVNQGDKFLRNHTLPPVELDSRISGLPPTRVTSGKFPEPGQSLPGATHEAEMLAKGGPKRKKSSIKTDVALTPEDLEAITRMYKGDK
jgi:hypothetical protein